MGGCAEGLDRHRNATLARPLRRRPRQRLVLCRGKGSLSTEVASEPGIVERAHQEPCDLPLEGDRAAIEFEERRVQPRSSGDEWRPGEWLPPGKLVVVEEHLDQDVLAEKQEHEERKSTPMPLTQDLAATPERKPHDPSREEANRPGISERVERPVQMHRNRIIELGCASHFYGLARKPAIREPQLPSESAREKGSTVDLRNPSREDSPTREQRNEKQREQGACIDDYYDAKMFSGHGLVASSWRESSRERAC